MKYSAPSPHKFQSGWLLRLRAGNFFFVVTEWGYKTGLQGAGRYGYILYHKASSYLFKAAIKNMI